MDGNSSEKKTDAWTRLKSMGYRVLDVLSCGYISKLERNLADSVQREARLANRVVNIEVSHRKERMEWERRIGMKEAENEGLVSTLGQRNKEIHSLEERLAGTEEEFEEQSIEMHNLREEFEGLTSSIEAFMMDHYYDFIEALNEVRELHRKAGMEELDDAELAKSVLSTVRYQKVAVKGAIAKVEEMKAVYKKHEREGILFEAATHVKGAIKIPIIVLDGDSKVAAISESAVKIMGYNPVGGDIGDVYSRLGKAVRTLIPTYENGFYVDNLFRNSVLEVFMKRTAEKEYKGAILIIEKGKAKRKDSLHRVVSEAVVYGKNVPIDLRKARNVPDEFAERLYGLSLSGFFREKTKIFVNNRRVYDKLIRYSVPEEMIYYTGFDEHKGKPETNLGLEGLAPFTV